MATGEDQRWGVIPLVDGREQLFRYQVTEEGETTLGFELKPQDERDFERHWRVEFKRPDRDPVVTFPITLHHVLQQVTPTRHEWCVRQVGKWIDELAARARGELLGGLYIGAARTMREFQAHVAELGQVESAEASKAVEQFLDRETRVVPLDDLSHSVVCLAQVEALDGMVLVEGVREDTEHVPQMVELRDSEPYPDPFRVRLLSPNQADAMWAAVYGARVAVWGEPTPFTSRS